MNKNQAKILAESVYRAMQAKKGNDLAKVIASFSEYLSQHHLVTMIPKILVELEKFYFADNNIVATKISSKDKLDESEIKKISDLVKARTNKEVVIKTEEDKDLLGGTIIKYNDKIIDMSLTKQLSNLEKQLSNS